MLFEVTMAKEKCFGDIEYSSVMCEENKEIVSPKGNCKGIIYRIALNTLKIILLLCIILFVVLPIIYRYSYAFQRSAVFLNFINVPATANYQHPEKYGLNGARNFYITVDDVKLGAWQILPSNLENTNDASHEFFEKMLNDGQNVVIYNHGNGGCRLTAHRVETYQVLRKFFHVITYDYRSYGDSSSKPPSEQTVVEDILHVYQWVRNRTESNVFIWGHSLGTSVSTHAIQKIQTLSTSQPVGLVLEAPFNNMKEEISEFPLAKIFKFLPWFRLTIVEPMSENFRFETDKYICGVNLPIMILHAEDDKVVPYKLGVKLYRSALKCRSESQGTLLFHRFSADHKFGHKFICRAADLPDKISNFIQLALENKSDKLLQQ
ncbi:lysophosphatidylserine lipase ABHD12 isoform X2 [Dendroctonus ponderosae]|uniref:Serine aminopeptidase S33 domain-containing protein n=2 Tax=Dendroctonus ponderosae TaxID=77166 RepID=A0AAR5QC81_DENPD|nr:lysophosphatidylserine lipase ABHD12 isoform X2 [Dendroctonus ponderosae]